MTQFPDLSNQQLHSLIDQFGISGPRYTSYPTAVQFFDDFTEADYYNQLQQQSADAPVSLYVHLPFCRTLCLYCACNKVVTKRRDIVTEYLDALEKEMQQISAQLRSRPVIQLHLGGGTPTYLTNEELERLNAMLGKQFSMVNDASEHSEALKSQYDMSIEIDPRSLKENTLETLKALRFNRVSIGVQDLNAKVLKSVNRYQPRSLIKETVLKSKELFQTVNFDLIYGLPHQTLESFGKTIEEIIELAPDRISLFNFAHLPTRFSGQQAFDPDFLPNSLTKLRMFIQSANQLTDAGYVYIGLDHFAKPDDSMVSALKDGTLHRNFQGYSTHARHDLIGLGVSSISQLNQAYSQNFSNYKEYVRRVRENETVVWRGQMLTAEDLLRREVIMNLMCFGKIDKSAIESTFNIAFDLHFADALEQIDMLSGDGIVQHTKDYVEVTGLGRLFLRNIAMCFDEYLGSQATLNRFSKAI